MLPIYVLTHPSHHWLLQGFSFLFNEFWGDPEQIVIIATSGMEYPKLSGNFGFLRLTDNSWSTSLITLLSCLPHDYLILLLEDYWLTDITQTTSIKLLYNWMETNPGLFNDVLRVDISGDRAAMKTAMPYDTWGYLEIIQTPPGTAYQMSIQVAIWNRKLLLDFLVRGETAWQFEINGTERLNNRPDIKVLGTKHCLINYEAIWRGRRHEFRNLEKIPYLDKIKKSGWLDGGRNG